MRSLCFGLLALVVVAHASGQQPPEPKAKPDAEAILGTWSIVGLEAGGKATSEKNFRGNVFRFEADKVTLQERGHLQIEFPYTLDPAKTPKTIDLAVAKGSNVIRGIYQLQGDELVLSLSLGGARPTAFATEQGGNAETFTLRRIPWARYADKAATFSVELPGKPEEWVRKSETPAGPATTTFLIARHDVDQVTYLAAVTPLPGKLTGKDVEAMMDSAIDAVAAEVDGAAKHQVESRNVFKAPLGYTATREVTGSLELPNTKDKVALRARLFIVGDRLCALAAVGLEEGTRSPNVGRFWNSFRLGDEKKESKK
jgi:uncharacterized protein (TIGR03067 family)